ncbi:oxygen-dependent protoporphyrinogen oxidase [Gryganskiella cystojenkinii]|nr:oxygen-dependent protoporphyrinogen oxidase [Gryganskiella cystojenkinii]
MAPRTHIAVIGGGISGLSAAWYLAKTAPSNVAITLLESSKRTSGWLHSDRVEDPAHPGGTILLERGPRSLRPQGISGLNTLEMVRDLGLESSLESVSKNSPAAKNRFIYSRNKLHKLPSSVMGAITHPLLAPKLPRAGMDLIVAESGQEDESIQDFVTRRFGKGFSDDLISAMVHGIYAGDVSKLSVRSTFGMLYHLEKEFKSVTLGLLMGGGGPIETPWDSKLKEGIMKRMPDLGEFVSKTSIYSFTDGLEALSKALEKDLRDSGRVEIRKDCRVEKLDFDLPKKSVKISICEKEPIRADHIIAALPPRKLHGLLTKDHPELVYNPSVTVAVVNLVYTTNNAMLSSPGFGYLVPRSEDSAVKHNGLLGVVYDSCSVPTQDQGPSRDQTLKLTAMIGGHMFDEVTSKESSHSKADLEAFFAKTARNTVRKHLQIEAEPELIKVHIHRECIPQYMVGHLERMQTLDGQLRSDYEGLLAVTGAGYLGISVNDCIKNAREVAEAVLSRYQEDEGEEDSEERKEAQLVGKHEAVTGLERSWFL